jgi:hypothetical protein
VTQLINYQRCPRQYYFDRVLRLPSADELSVWNNAEVPEPPANLTATLKGAVIHRFCERYSSDVDVEVCLRQSFDEVVRLRQAELADRLVEIEPIVAVKDLLPLAKNYLTSDVFRRVEAARKMADEDLLSRPLEGAGLWSELSFRLRRPLGVLSGAIDKLLITGSDKGDWEVEIIDFKTNRIVIPPPAPVTHTETPPSKSRSGQFAFDFERAAAAPVATLAPEATLPDAVLSVAKDYQLQMQSYALAVRELLPSLANARIRVTLHFLEPNLEFQLSEDLVEARECERVIDAAMLRIISSAEPGDFPVVTAPHCRMCNFLRVCSAGREWLKNQEQEH